MSVQWSVVDDDQKRGLATTTEGTRVSAIANSRDFTGRPACTFSSIRTIARVSCLLFGAAAWRLRHPLVVRLRRSSANVPDRICGRASGPADAPGQGDRFGSGQLRQHPITAAHRSPGTEIYAAKRGEAILAIARRYLGRTSYLTSAELAGAIRHVNGDRTANILESQ